MSVSKIILAGSDDLWSAELPQPLKNDKGNENCENKGIFLPCYSNVILYGAEAWLPSWLQKSLLPYLQYNGIFQNFSFA